MLVLSFDRTNNNRVYLKNGLSKIGERHGGTAGKDGRHFFPSNKTIKSRGEEISFDRRKR